MTTTRKATLSGVITKTATLFWSKLPHCFGPSGHTALVKTASPGRPAQYAGPRALRALALEPRRAFGQVRAVCNSGLQQSARPHIGVSVGDSNVWPGGLLQATVPSAQATKRPHRAWSLPKRPHHFWWKRPQKGVNTNATRRSYQNGHRYYSLETVIMNNSSDIH